MTRYQRRCDEMFTRVGGFEQRFREAFPESSPGGRALAEVRAARSEIAALLTERELAVDSPRWRARERLALVRALLSITRTARRLARAERRVDRTFVMPDPRTDGALIETARTFARDLVPLEDRCVGLGMPPTFLADLRETTDRFERAVQWRRGAQIAASAVRAGLDTAFRRGFDAVLTLDVVVANAHPGNRVLLATWKVARRIDRKRVRKTKRKQPDHAGLARGTGARRSTKRETTMVIL